MTGRPESKQSGNAIRACVRFGFIAAPRPRNGGDRFVRFGDEQKAHASELSGTGFNKALESAVGGDIDAVF